MNSPSPQRAAGLVLAACAVISVIDVALDIGASGHTKAEILASMVDLRARHQLVHMIAMACLAGLAFGFTTLAQQANLRRAPVLAGLICYLVGTLAMMGGVLIDGFITIDLALSYVKGTPEEVATGYHLIQFAYVVLQNLANLSWVMQACGVLLVSSALVTDAGRARMLGLVGLAAGALPIVAIAATYPNMSQTLVVGILLVQGIWNLSAAAFLIRGPGTALRPSGMQTAAA